MSAEIKPIRCDADYEAAIAEAKALMDAEPVPRNRLAVLAVLIRDFESRKNSDDGATPIDSLVLDMNLKGRTQADLAKVLSSRSRASELLAGRRVLTASMADRIAQAWGIPRRLLGPPTQRKPKPRLMKAPTAAVFILCATLLASGGTFVWATHDLPDVSAVAMARKHDSDVRLADLPDFVTQAFLAAEDSRFYFHGGSDPRHLARATVDTLANALAGRRPSGGSTISEQVVKNTALRNEPRGLRRRIRQLVLASELDAQVSKDRIFETYLNALYFGGDVRGLGQAAQTYFGVRPENLTLEQAAVLAAIPSAPNRFRIDLPENRERARARRDWVLARMNEQGFLTQASVVRARAAPLP